MDKNIFEKIILTAASDLESFVKSSQQEGKAEDFMNNIFSSFVVNDAMKSKTEASEPKPQADNMLNVVDASGKLVATVDKDFLLQYLLKK